MTREAGGHAPANMQKYLSGVDYPAEKQDLIECARRNNAPDEVMQEIRRLPDEQYGGPQDVMKGYGNG